MKNIFLIATILFGFISCSDDHELIIKQIKLVKVDTETILDPNQTFNGSIEFKYGDNNFVEETIGGGGISHKYIYNTMNQLVKIIYDNNNGVSYNINYSYTNGLITTETYEGGSATHYFYNNTNQLVRIYYDIPAGSYSLYLTYDSNENVVNLIRDSEIVDSFEYDNKPNPYRLLFPDAYSKINRIGNNNATFRKDSERVTTYEYNYNNYPTKGVQRIDVVGAVKIKEFFYN